MMVVDEMLRLFLPRCCPVCGRKLLASEKELCTDCLRLLPKAEFEAWNDNEMYWLFPEHPAVMRCGAYFKYVKGSDYAQIIYATKYWNHPEVGRKVARLAAEEFEEKHFFDGVDVVIPVPLSKRRRHTRGYNQTEWIAKGLVDVTGLTLETKALERLVDNRTQTALSDDERRRNVEGIFSVRHPERLSGRHVLLLDDVVTTGATLSSCVDAIVKAAPDVRLTLFALACASDG